jgi:AraC-like DNA-binding protein
MQKKIKRLTYSAERELGIEIIPIDNEYVTTRKNLMQPNRSSFYAILWFSEGSPTHLVDFQPVKIIKDSYLFIGKDVVQFFDQQHTFKAHVLLFTDDFFCRDRLDQQFLGSSILFNTINDQEAACLTDATSALKEIWALMKRELERPKDIYQTRLLRNLLQNFLFTAERANGQRKGNSMLLYANLDILLQFKALIEKNYKEQRPVIYYTKLLHVSIKVLSKTTQEIVGRTPKQLIDDRVLLEAKRLLVNSTNAGKTIGYELGFNEPTNFIKYFRRHTGMTPVDFRARYTDG